MNCDDQDQPTWLVGLLVAVWVLAGASAQPLPKETIVGRTPAQSDPPGLFDELDKGQGRLMYGMPEKREPGTHTLFDFEGEKALDFWIADEGASVELVQSPWPGWGQALQVKFPRNPGQHWPRISILAPHIPWPERTPPSAFLSFRLKNLKPVRSPFRVHLRSRERDVHWDIAEFHVPAAAEREVRIVLGQGPVPSLTMLTEFMFWVSGPPEDYEFIVDEIVILPGLSEALSDIRKEFDVAEGILYAEADPSMPADQLHKDLFHLFLPDYLRVFYPDEVPRLKLETITWLEQETFTDVPEGEQQIMDLCARVETVDEDYRLLAILIELQEKVRRDFPRRMYRYWNWTEERISLPVWPLALLPTRVYRGQGRLVYSLTRMGRPTLRFEFDYVALRGLPAPTYLAKEVPFSAALAARMRPGRLRPAEHKLACLRGIAGHRLDPAREFLLTNYVETYLPLEDPAEKVLFEELTATEADEETQAMLVTWADRKEMDGQRKLLLWMMQQKFPELPEQAAAHVQAISDVEEMKRLTARLLKARTPADLGLDSR